MRKLDLLLTAPVVRLQSIQCVSNRPCGVITVTITVSSLSWGPPLWYVRSQLSLLLTSLVAMCLQSVQLAADPLWRYACSQCSLLLSLLLISWWYGCC